MTEKIKIDETIFAKMALNYYEKYIEGYYSSEAIELSGLNKKEFIVDLAMSDELYDIFVQNLAAGCGNQISSMTGSGEVYDYIHRMDYRKHIPGLQELHDWLEDCEELLVDDGLKLRLEEAKNLLESNGYTVEVDY